MGQSQSVERSMHLWDPIIEIEMQAQQVCLSVSLREHSCGRNVRQAPPQPRLGASHHGHTLQWKKSLPRPMPRLHMPQSLQW